MSDNLKNRYSDTAPKNLQTFTKSFFELQLQNWLNLELVSPALIWEIESLRKCHGARLCYSFNSYLEETKILAQNFCSYKLLRKIFQNRILVKGKNFKRKYSLHEGDSWRKTIQATNQLLKLWYVFVWKAGTASLFGISVNPKFGTNFYYGKFSQITVFWKCFRHS